MIRGDHLSVFRGSYWHHGIFIGNGEVIHFNGSLENLGNAKIQKDTLSTFESNSIVKVVSYPGIDCFPPPEVVRRAKSRLGQKGYSLLHNNCEHFATWCKTGKHESLQYDNANNAVGVIGGLYPPVALVKGVAEVVETIAYQDQCACGRVLRGLSTIWLCRDCGKKYCRGCLHRRPIVDSWASSAFGWIGSGTRQNTCNYKCVCGNVIDGSQKIRQGVM